MFSRLSNASAAAVGGTRTQRPLSRKPVLEDGQCASKVRRNRPRTDPYGQPAYYWPISFARALAFLAWMVRHAHVTATAEYGDGMAMADVSAGTHQETTRILLWLRLKRKDADGSTSSQWQSTPYKGSIGLDRSVGGFGFKLLCGNCCC